MGLLLPHSSFDPVSLAGKLWAAHSRFGIAAPIANSKASTFCPRGEIRHLKATVPLPLAEEGRAVGNQQTIDRSGGEHGVGHDEFGPVLIPYLPYLQGRFHVAELLEQRGQLEQRERVQNLLVVRIEQRRLREQAARAMPSRLDLRGSGNGRRKAGASGVAGGKVEKRLGGALGGVAPSPGICGARSGLLAGAASLANSSSVTRSTERLSSAEGLPGSARSKTTTAPMTAHDTETRSDRERGFASPSASEGTTSLQTLAIKPARRQPRATARDRLIPPVLVMHRLQAEPPAPSRLRHIGRRWWLALGAPDRSSHCSHVAMSLRRPRGGPRSTRLV